MKMLLDAGADSNAQDVDGNSILMKAVLNNQIVIMGMLIEYGADTTLKNRHGQTLDDMKRMAHLSR
jgi:ankyrin repeat protein